MLQQLVLLSCLMQLIKGQCSTNHRHRKPWRSLTQIERDVYINGFRQLADLGISQQITQKHTDILQNHHGTEFFLPWHRAYIYELENAIRNLGGVYECFAMPYW